MLLTPGSLVTLVLLDVRGFRLVLARGRADPVCRVSKYRFGGFAGQAMAIPTLVL